MELDRTKTASGTPEAADDAARASVVGSHLDKYLVVEQLGAGGVGVVYRAYDPDLDRSVALKLLKGRPGGSQDAGRARLVREAQAIARLSHPNVVSVFEVGVHGDEVFIAMELVAGESLRDWMRRDHSVDEILDVFEQAAAGLSAAHAKDIVHRDFKPTNALIGDDGVVRVVDFGLARTTGGSGSDAPAADSPEPATVPELEQTLTATGTVLGTPAYMAPEQFVGGTVDARADQYSFCMSLYEALAGKRPFVRTRMPIGAPDEGPMPPTGRRGVPAWLEAALRRGLASDPADRFASMDELMGAIARRRRPRAPRILAVAGLAGAIGVAVFFAMGTDAPAPCQGFEEQMAQVWNDAQQRAIERAFQDTELGFADIAFAETRRSLDRYARAWVRSRQQTCEATRVRGDQSDALLELRMACLDRRRDELAALIALLANADRELVARAMQAASGLTPLSVCDDADALRAQVPLPEAPQRRAAVFAVQAQLAQVRAQFEAGQFADGAEAAAHALAQARSLEHSPTVAEALYWSGRYAAANDDPAGARAALEEAARKADAGRDDRLRFRAHVALVALDTGDVAEIEQGDRDYEQARALLARVGGEPLLEVELLEARARVHLHRGDYQRGLEQAQRMAELREDNLPPEHPDHAASLTLIGDAEGRLGHLDRAIELLEQAETKTRETLGEDHPAMMAVYEELSQVHRRHGTNDDSDRYSRKVIENAVRFYGEQHSQVARGYNLLGNSLVEQRRYDEALPVYEKALEMRKAIQGPNSRAVAVTYANISLVYNRIGDGDKAVDNGRKALAAYEASIGPEHPLTGKGHIILAGAIETQGRYDDAAAEYRRALEILRANDPRHLWQIDAIRGLADCLFHKGRHAEALEELEYGLALSTEKQEAPHYLAELELKTAEALWRTNKDRPRARKLAQQALAHFEEAKRPDQATEARTWLSTH